MSAFSDMKNAVIGNNKQKANLIVLGAVPRYVSAQPLPPTISFNLLAIFWTIKNDIQVHLLCVCSLAAGYSTCSSRAHPVWSYEQSVLWCWAASPWAPRTTSSPWWTATSSLPFFKVGVHTHTHACKYPLQRATSLVTCRDTEL